MLYLFIVVVVDIQVYIARQSARGAKIVYNLDVYVYNLVQIKRSSRTKKMNRKFII